MAQGKYIKDYRLVETVDERGRIRTDYEYIGADYHYARGLPAVRPIRRRALGAALVGWLAFLGGLLPNSRGMHALYVSLPYIFSALPLATVTAVLLQDAPEKEPLEHRQADRLENRYPPAALAAGILPCAALAGELIRLLTGQAVNGGDGLACLGAAVTAAAGFFLFSLRRGFQVRKG